MMLGTDDTMMIAFITLGEIMKQLRLEISRLVLPSFIDWRCLRYATDR